jgi:hypothetical protein
LGGQEAIPAERSVDWVFGEEIRVCQVTVPWVGSGKDSGSDFVEVGGRIVGVGFGGIFQMEVRGGLEGEVEIVQVVLFSGWM